VDDVEVAGLRIAYERRGEGPPLLLLHGVLGDARHWSRQIDALARDFTVVAWEAPGHGRSDDPPESWGTGDFSACLAAFVETLGLGRPHVAGLSWGSALALDLYRLRPDLPRTLVLASAYAGWAGSLPPEEVARRRDQGLREAGMAPEEFVPGWLPGLLTRRARPELVAETAETMSGFHPAGYRAVFRTMAETDLRGVLPGIAVPTLLLYGAEDVRSPVHVGEDLHARIPGSRLLVLPEVGHLCNMEAHDAFNAAVRDFLLACEGR
jgi:pimeloyl-ACP methyl ester carboxylesterase